MRVTLGAGVPEPQTRSKMIDFHQVVQTSDMTGEDEEERELLNQMLEEASDYLTSFAWCEAITESYVGIAIGGVVAVFLFRIRPARTDVDEWLWVIVGDLPTAYITTVGIPDPPSALKAYITEMRRWVNAVTSGRPVSELIPVDVAPTPENAELLAKRLRFLEDRILPLQ